jgi:adenine-specific DNA-methyltransferase
MLKVIIDASSNKEDIVLDCFSGSGTTLIAAEQLGRRWIGIDNSPKAIEITLRRLQSLERVRPFILYNCSDESLSQLIQEIL